MIDSVDRIFAGLRKVRDVAQKIHDAELQNALAELTLDLAQLKSEMATVHEQNTVLRSEVAVLRQHAEIRSKTELRNGCYYLTAQVAGYSNGPFCTRCLDVDRNLVTLRGPGWQPGKTEGSGVLRTPDGTVFTCPECAR